MGLCKADGIDARTTPDRPRASGILHVTVICLVQKYDLLPPRFTEINTETWLWEENKIAGLNQKYSPCSSHLPPHRPPTNHLLGESTTSLSAFCPHTKKASPTLKKRKTAPQIPRVQLSTPPKEGGKRTSKGSEPTQLQRPESTASHPKGNSGIQTPPRGEQVGEGRPNINRTEQRIISS